MAIIPQPRESLGSGHSGQGDGGRGTHPRSAAVSEKLGIGASELRRSRGESLFPLTGSHTHNRLAYSPPPRKCAGWHTHVGSQGERLTCFPREALFTG